MFFVCSHRRPLFCFQLTIFCLDLVYSVPTTACDASPEDEEPEAVAGHDSFQAETPPNVENSLQSSMEPESSDGDVVIRQ